MTPARASADLDEVRTGSTTVVIVLPLRPPIRREIGGCDRRMLGTDDLPILLGLEGVRGTAFPGAFQGADLGLVTGHRASLSIGGADAGHVKLSQRESPFTEITKSPRYQIRHPAVDRVSVDHPGERRP